MNYLYINDEIPKYKKKANKIVRKAKHKHLYKDCLILDRSSGYYHKGEYCTLCGKLANFSMLETVKASGRFSRMLSKKELLDAYEDLEIKEVENIVKDRVVKVD